MAAKNDGMMQGADRLYEQVLVLRCQTGDHAAFAEIMTRYSPRLRYFLRRMLGPDHAEDALQDVWLAVFRGVSRLSNVAAFSTWLYRIARDRAYSELRSAGKWQTMTLDVDCCEAEDAMSEFSSDHAEQIHASLSLLVPEHREVLTLRFLEDMTYEQIAQIVGCPLGTVRSRIHYAKAALRKLIERRTSDG